jgi:hypothetical protein
MFEALIGWATAAARAAVRMPELAAEPRTAGGDDQHEAWDGGWWRGARRQPAHPGRVGGRCTPWAVVVHTTDMAPGTWDGLMRRLQRDAGRGAGAHFWLGRTPEQGLVQSVAVDRNANHAVARPETFCAVETIPAAIFVPT